MHVKTLHHGEKLFTHVDEVTGENTVIVADRLVKHCEDSKKHDIVLVPVLLNVAQLIVQSHGVEELRFKSIERAILEHVQLPPLVYCHTGDPHNVQPSDEWLLVDGNNRYVAYAVHEISLAEAYLVRQETWRRFLVTGVDTLTAEELRRTTRTFI